MRTLQRLCRVEIKTLLLFPLEIKFLKQRCLYLNLKTNLS